MTAKPAFLRLAGMGASAILLAPVLFSRASAQTPPSITLQPVSQTNAAGSRVVLSVAATGSGPFAYQWLFNGTPLPFPALISTVAGNGAPAYTGDGGAATNASLNDPATVATDGSGDLFIADTMNNAVRKVDPFGFISTVAGGGADSQGDGEPATNAFLYRPTQTALDANGNLYIASSQANYVHKVDINGVISTVAGDGTPGYSGDGGPARDAILSNPTGVTVDPAGNLLITEVGNNVVRKVDTRGIITTVAGNGLAAYDGDGGAATNASLNGPCVTVVDAAGRLLIADGGNNCIRMVGANGVITTVAGGGTNTPGDDGPATNALLAFPSGVVVDSAGNLYIADSEENRIRKVDTNGVITTVAGNGKQGFSGDGDVATNAMLNLPSGVTLAPDGNLYAADAFNNLIRKVTIATPPSLSITNISAATAGDYQVVITSPYGSVTSAVARLTVAPSGRNPMIVMQRPLIAGDSILLGFNLAQASNASFTLLQSEAVTGPWTTNSSAILTTNGLTGGYQFALPIPAATEFYKLRSQ